MPNKHKLQHKGQNNFFISGTKHYASNISILHEGKIVFNSGCGFMSAKSSNNDMVQAIIDIDYIAKRKTTEEVISSAKKSFVCGEKVYVVSTDLPHFELLENRYRVDECCNNYAYPRVAFNTGFLWLGDQKQPPQRIVFEGRPIITETPKSRATKELAQLLSNILGQDINADNIREFIDKQGEIQSAIKKALHPHVGVALS